MGMCQSLDDKYNDKIIALTKIVNSMENKISSIEEKLSKVNKHNFKFINPVVGNIINAEIINDVIILKLGFNMVENIFILNMTFISASVTNKIMTELIFQPIICKTNNPQSQEEIYLPTKNTTLKKFLDHFYNLTPNILVSPNINLPSTPTNIISPLSQLRRVYGGELPRENNGLDTSSGKSPLAQQIQIDLPPACNNFTPKHKMLLTIRDKSF